MNTTHHTATKHHARYPLEGEANIGAYLRRLADLRTAPSSALVTMALELLTLTLLRPTELVRLRWVEVQLEAAMPHLYVKAHGHLSRVYLSTQAVALLQALRTSLLSSSTHVFPGLVRARPLSPDALTAALSRLSPAGGRLSSFSLRETYSQWASEHQVDPDMIALLLRRLPRSHKVRAAYNQRADAQQAAAQQWADALDRMRGEPPAGLVDR